MWKKNTKTVKTIIVLAIFCLEVCSKGLVSTISSLVSHKMINVEKSLRIFKNLASNFVHLKKILLVKQTFQ